MQQIFLARQRSYSLVSSKYEKELGDVETMVGEIHNLKIKTQISNKIRFIKS